MRSTILNYVDSIKKVQRKIRKILRIRSERTEVLDNYWHKALDIVKFSVNHPNNQKKLKGTALSLIASDETVVAYSRISKYLVEYQSTLTSKRYEFFKTCRANGTKGHFALLVYNLLNSKKQQEALKDEDVVEMYLEEAMEMIMNDKKALKAILSRLKVYMTNWQTGTMTSQPSSILPSNTSLSNILNPLEVSHSKKRSVSLTKKETSKPKFTKQMSKTRILLIKGNLSESCVEDNQALYGSPGRHKSIICRCRRSLDDTAACQDRR